MVEAQEQKSHGPETTQEDSSGMQSQHNEDPPEYDMDMVINVLLVVQGISRLTIQDFTSTDAYKFQLRVHKALIVCDDSLKSFILQDFCEETRCLQVSNCGL